MTDILIILSGLVTLAAALPYLRETASGQTKPRVASWLIWGAITAIGATAAFTQHQIPAAIYALLCAFECFAIALIGLRQGDLRLAWLDSICLIGAIAGLVALILARSPEIALMTVLITDFLGSIPTIVHAWGSPGEETLSTYSLNTLGSGIILLAANIHIFTAIGYPLYLFILDGALASIIFVRRRHSNIKSADNFTRKSTTPPLPVPIIYYPTNQSSTINPPSPE
jgi:hypothetical protein